jgi:uncharacterized protein (DUF2336 family)
MKQIDPSAKVTNSFIGEDLLRASEGPDRTRVTLFRRLQDVVGLPSSRISPQERHMASDLLVEMLRESDLITRIRCSERLSLINDVPPILLRVLGRDDIEVARPLLEVCPAYNDSDLISIASWPKVTIEHRLLIAKRKKLNETVVDVMVEFQEPEVVAALLQNETAHFAHPALETATALSKSYPDLISLLLKRAELKPSHALTMFWWANSDDRKRILQRFGVERITLLEAAQDLFPRAAKDNWQDPLVRKSLQFIERRQRNRAAAEKSPYGSLEGAVEALEQEFNPVTIREIAFLAGIKPACGAQIMSDAGGEAISILCKATGLKRRYFRMLWKGMRRPLGTDEQPSETFERASYIFDSISTNKAQTILRYWNWALTSAMSPALAAKLDNDSDLNEDSVAARVSQLVFGNPNR